MLRTLLLRTLLLRTLLLRALLLRALLLGAGFLWALLLPRRWRFGHHVMRFGLGAVSRVSIVVRLFGVVNGHRSRHALHLKFELGKRHDP